MTDRFLAMGRRGVLGFAIPALIVAASLRAAASEADAAAIAPIQNLNAGLLAAMKAGPSTPFEQRYAGLAPVVEQTFDLDSVLAGSIGLRWADLTNDQKSLLLAAFRRYSVASYTASFDNFNGQSFRVLPTVRPVGTGEVVVQSKVVSADGSATELDYVMRNGPSGWKAVDVLANGAISRVAVQRSDFRSVLAAGGVPALVTALQHKVANLSA